MSETVTEKRGWLSRLRHGLTRTKSALADGVSAIFTKRKLDDDTIEELEDLLIAADLGPETARHVTETLRGSRYNKDVTTAEVQEILAAEVASVLNPLTRTLTIDRSAKPHVILMVGVNGSGKTTTIGKLARQFRDSGLSVMLAAGDTFRAAAIEQLQVWGQRTGVPVVASRVGADASGLAFEAMERARAENIDVLMIDTAGRLQNKQGLMDELAKIRRVIQKQDTNAPHDVILVLDATTGQNAIAQADVFRQVAGVTGIIMTKLDGTAKGGVLVALARRIGLPLFAIGVGEAVEDLQPFDGEHFARALVGLENG